MKATAKLVANGKITVPATIRHALGLEDGDLVEIDFKPIDTDTDTDTDEA